MSNEKILKVMAEVNGEVCERGELIHGIALALLTRKNLFVLGDVGQAKSYAIDRFCKRITGAKQFSTLMNKQTDTEQLFGRFRSCKPYTRALAVKRHRQRPDIFGYAK